MRRRRWTLDASDIPSVLWSVSNHHGVVTECRCEIHEGQAVVTIVQGGLVMNQRCTSQLEVALVTASEWHEAMIDSGWTEVSSSPPRVN